jgi:hypothetical protein
MATTAKKFNNLQSLEKEIRRLKLHAKQMEDQFDDNFSHLQENYIGMVLNSVLPEKPIYKGIPATIVSLFLEHDRFRNTMIKLAEQLIDKASDGIDYISEKLARKKD